LQIWTERGKSGRDFGLDSRKLITKEDFLSFCIDFPVHFVPELTHSWTEWTLSDGILGLPKNVHFGHFFVFGFGEKFLRAIAFTR
jgi:hypothetical protein